MWPPGLPCRHQSREWVSISPQFSVLSCHFRGKTVVFGCVPQCGHLGRALRSHVAPRAGAAPHDSSTVFIFLHLVCSILPPSPVCGYVFITLILLDHLPPDPTAAWRTCAAFLSGCFQVAPGKMDKHTVPQSTVQPECLPLNKPNSLPHTAECPRHQRDVPGSLSSCLPPCRSYTKFPLKITFLNQLNNTLINQKLS